jgi:hypothetical protein
MEQQYKERGVIRKNGLKRSYLDKGKTSTNNHEELECEYT